MVVLFNEDKGVNLNTIAINSLQPKRTPPVPNAVLGTLVAVVVEIMFFSALISAFLVIRAGAGLRWVPPPNVRLPVEATLVNTIFLLISGVLIVLAAVWVQKSPNKSRWAFLASTLLGATFVILQGREWINLLSLGMTIGSGIFAATFFLLIGSHGLHAISAIIAMLFILAWSQLGIYKPKHVQAMMVYWLFIVGIWPILYRLVYF